MVLCCVAGWSKAYFFPPYQVSQHPCLYAVGHRSGWGSCIQILPFYYQPRIKTKVSFSKWPSGFFRDRLMALLALCSEALWPVQVSIHNCYARQRKLIHFNGSCVFLFVTSAIAGCESFLRHFKEISSTLYLIGESRHQTPPPPDTFPQVGCVYFRAVWVCGLLTCIGHQLEVQRIYTQKIPDKSICW